MVGGEPLAGGWWLRATGQSGNNEVWPSGHFTRVTGLLQFLTPISESPPPPLVIRRVDTVLQHGHSSIASISPRPFSPATSTQIQSCSSLFLVAFHFVARLNWRIASQLVVREAVNQGVNKTIKVDTAARHSTAPPCKQTCKQSSTLFKLLIMHYCDYILLLTLLL